MSKFEDNSKFYLPNGAWGFKHELCFVEENINELPEMPESVIYRGTCHEMQVKPYSSLYGDIYIGFRQEGNKSKEMFRGLHMDAEDVLSLCHDLRRYAMDAIRKRQE